MFGDLLRLFSAPEPGRLAEPDANLALAALLVRVARSDGGYSEAERAHIDRLLAAHQSLTPFEAAHLRAEAEALEAAAPDTVRFTRVLKEAVPLERRLALIEAMWAVALADGGRSSDEDHAIRLICGLLGVTDVQSGLARQRLAQRAGG